MNKMIACLKTFLAYWVFAGLISVVIELPLIALGLYTPSINMMALMFGIIFSVVVYYIRRKK